MHLLSFVGTTDGQLAPEGKGPILTAVSALKPSAVTLIVTEGDSDRHDYQTGASAVKKAIAKIKPEIIVRRVTMDLNDPTDHNDIYPKLREIVTNTAAKADMLVAAISSGTPSMQVCWILLAESGEAAIRLVRTIDPSFTKQTCRDVKLGIGLPRIVALEEENAELQEIALPQVTMNVSKGIVKIGDITVDFAPRMFTYYRYFLELAKDAKTADDAMLPVRGAFVITDFSKKIVAFHEKSFPHVLDEIKQGLKKNSEFEILSTVFRSTISKLNARVVKAVKDPRLHRYLTIVHSGPKSARQYGIKLPAAKISIR